MPKKSLINATCGGERTVVCWCISSHLTRVAGMRITTFESHGLWILYAPHFFH